MYLIIGLINLTVLRKCAPNIEIMQNFGDLGQQPLV